MRIITNRSWVFGCDIEIKLQSSRLKAGAVRSNTKSIYVAIFDNAQYICPHLGQIACTKYCFFTFWGVWGRTFWYKLPKMWLMAIRVSKNDSAPMCENMQVSHSKLKSSLPDFFTRWVWVHVSQIEEDGSWRNFEKLTADCTWHTYRTGQME